MWHRDSCEIALREKHVHEDAADSTSQQLADLKLVFAKAAEADIPTEVGALYIIF